MSNNPSRHMRRNQQKQSRKSYRHFPTDRYGKIYVPEDFVPSAVYVGGHRVSFGGKPHGEIRRILRQYTQSDPDFCRCCDSLTLPRLSAEAEAKLVVELAS